MCHNKCEQEPTIGIANFNFICRGLLPALSKSPFENDEDGGQTTKQNAESEMPPLTSPWASSSTHAKQLKTYPSENIWTSLASYSYMSLVLSTNHGKCSSSISQ